MSSASAHTFFAASPTLGCLPIKRQNSLRGSGVAPTAMTARNGRFLISSYSASLFASCPSIPIICEKYKGTSEIPSAAKINHPTAINKRAYTCRSARGKRSMRRPRNAFSAASTAKKYNPQARKFNPAPCHIPVSDQTISKFRYVLPLPRRLPPKGM